MNTLRAVWDLFLLAMVLLFVAQQSARIKSATRALWRDALGPRRRPLMRIPPDAIHVMPAPARPDIDPPSAVLFPPPAAPAPGSVRTRWWIDLPRHPIDLRTHVEVNGWAHGNLDDVVPGDIVTIHRPGPSGHTTRAVVLYIEVRPVYGGARQLARLAFHPGIRDLLPGATITPH